MTSWRSLNELHISLSEFCLLIFLIPTLLFVKAWGKSGKLPHVRKWATFLLNGYLKADYVGNIFLAEYLAERNIFLWSCIIGRKENPTCQCIYSAFCFLEVWVVFVVFLFFFNCGKHLILSARRKDTAKVEILFYTAKMLWWLCCFCLTNKFCPEECSS